jgi:hypothetical protein
MHRYRVRRVGRKDSVDMQEALKASQLAAFRMSTTGLAPPWFERWVRAAGKRNGHFVTGPGRE